MLFAQYPWMAALKDRKLFSDGKLMGAYGIVWSLLLASGYLKVISVDFINDNYQLALTNYEVEKMFRGMISGWFKRESANYNEEDEHTLTDTVNAALKQIEDKKYAQVLTRHGVPADHIQKYAFAFEGKKVLIG